MQTNQTTQQPTTTLPNTKQQANPNQTTNKHVNHTKQTQLITTPVAKQTTVNTVKPT